MFQKNSRNFAKRDFTNETKVYIIGKSASQRQLSCGQIVPCDFERKIFLNLLRAWNQISLVKRILVGLIVGVMLGLVIPSFQVIGVWGDLSAR